MHVHVLISMLSVNKDGAKKNDNSYENTFVPTICSTICEPVDAFAILQAFCNY